MDITLQKSVELGVNQIVPVICERSNSTIKIDRIQKKMLHWQKIIISACEQSGRAVIPQLMDASSFNSAMKLYRDYTRIILSTDPSAQSMATLKKPVKVCVFIGPEGGFTTEELSVASKHAYLEIGFGRRILRTETAGPAVISAVQTLWGDLK